MISQDTVRAATQDLQEALEAGESLSACLPEIAMHHGLKAEAIVANVARAGESIEDFARRCLQAGANKNQIEEKLAPVRAHVDKMFSQNPDPKNLGLSSTLFIQKNFDRADWLKASRAAKQQEKLNRLRPSLSGTAINAPNQ